MMSATYGVVQTLMLLTRLSIFAKRGYSDSYCLKTRRQLLSALTEVEDMNGVLDYISGHFKRFKRHLDL